MGTADGWDLTVPADDAELLAELRRHGVRPGQRLRIVETLHAEEVTESPVRDASRPCRQRRFAAMGTGPSDVSTNTDAYLSGFGEQ